MPGFPGRSGPPPWPPCRRALERHLSPQRGLPGPIDDAHPALSQLRKQLKLPTFRCACRCSGVGSGAAESSAGLSTLGDLGFVDRHFRRGPTAPAGRSRSPSDRCVIRSYSKDNRSCCSPGRPEKKQHVLVLRPRTESEAKGKRSRSEPGAEPVTSRATAFSVRQTGRRRAGQLNGSRRRAFSPDQFETLNLPISRNLYARRRCKRAAAPPESRPGQNLGQTRQEACGPSVVAAVVGQLPGGGVRKDLVAIAHEVIEQVLQTDGGPTSLSLFSQHFEDGRVQAGGSRQIVPSPTQQKFGHCAKPWSPRDATPAQEAAELPPLPQMGPPRCFSLSTNWGRGGPAPHIPRWPSKPAGACRLPQIEGRQVPLERIDRAVGPAVSFAKGSGRRRTSSSSKKWVSSMTARPVRFRY